MENMMQKKIKYIIFAIALLVVVWAGFAIRNVLTFHIVSTNPLSSNISDISPFFDISFNKDLTNRVLVTSSLPAVESYKVQGKELVIQLNIPLNPKQKYEIMISNIYAKSGQYIKPQYYSFTPKNINNNTLPIDQSQALLNKEKQYDQSIEANKLVQLLPFIGPGFEYRIDYTVDYSAQADTPVIEITGATPQAQQDALSWIKNQGYDTSGLKITYNTAEPQ
jgi:hypothetical protein